MMQLDMSITPSCKLKQSTNKPKNPKDDNWFDKDCKDLRQNIWGLSNQKHRYKKCGVVPSLL